jgi:hypothetical protein
MKLKLRDFQSCRRTDDGLIVIPDAFQTFQGDSCTVQRSIDVWNNEIKPKIMKNRQTCTIFIEYRQFKRSDGRLGRGEIFLVRC